MSQSSDAEIEILDDKQSSDSSLAPQPQREDDAVEFTFLVASPEKMKATIAERSRKLQRSTDDEEDELSSESPPPKKRTRRTQTRSEAAEEGAEGEEEEEEKEKEKKKNKEMVKAKAKEKAKERAKEKAKEKAKAKETEKAKEMEQAKAKAKGKIKQKKKLAKDDEDDSDASDKDAQVREGIKITVYCYVEREASALKGKGAPKLDDTHLVRPPFSFLTTSGYSDLLEAIAKVLPCAQEDLLEDKMEWRFTTPAHSKLKPLGGEIGFDAMIETAEGRSKASARHLELLMPAPRRPEVHWETSRNESPPPKFNFDALGEGSAGRSIRVQQIKVDAAIADARQRVEDAHPVDNDPEYPGKRIWKSPQGFKIELTVLRIVCWASHLNSKTPGVTEKIPPNVAHFERANQLKPPRPSTVAPNSATTTLISTTTPTPMPVPQSLDSTTQDLALRMAMQQNDMYRAMLFSQSPSSFFPFQPFQNHTPMFSTIPTPIFPTASRPQPPSPVRARISLDLFCDHYDIDLEDRPRLADLRYRPGDHNIRNVPEQERKDAGFTSMAWGRIIDAHEQFIRDVRAGVFPL